MNSLREFDETYEGTVLGVDEAGRGPLAGAVVAGAVIIPEYFSELDEINDSKKLTEKKREKLFEIIIEKCIVGIGISDEKEIDEVNILNATFSAMRKATFLKLSLWQTGTIRMLPAMLEVRSAR